MTAVNADYPLYYKPIFTYYKPIYKFNSIIAITK